MAVPTLPIRTERLLLRPFVDGDLEAFYDMYRRDEVARYLPWEPRTREMAVEMLERVKTLTSFDVDGHAIRLAGVMERLGMRREALFHHNELIKGEWSDQVVYAMLEDEWRARG